jgi:hypothetical protein
MKGKRQKTSWLIVLVLEALGLFLLWNGARGGDEVQTALGIVLVVSVTALFLFRLLVRALERRRSGEVRPPAATIPLFIRPTHRILVDTLLGARAVGRGGRGGSSEGSSAVDGIDLDVGGDG